LIVACCALATSGALLAARTGYADTPPSATTGGATGPPWATLSGTINDQGLPATYYFEYGLTDSYGFTSTGASAPPSAADQPVQATVNAFYADSTYHYRLVLSTTGGPVYGTDATFMVPDSPNSPPGIPPPPRTVDPPASPTTPTTPTTPTIVHCVVPNVVRRPLADAKRRIIHAHCSIGRIKRLASRTHCRRQVVVAQSPKPPVISLAGRRIGLTICAPRR
jgi:hypothetical protein